MREAMQNPFVGAYAHGLRRHMHRSLIQTIGYVNANACYNSSLFGSKALSRDKYEEADDGNSHDNGNE